MKKLISVLSAAALLASMTACGSSESGSESPASSKSESSAADTNTDESSSDESSKSEDSGSSEGKTTLNIWSFTEEVPGMVQKYIDTHPDFAAKYDIETTVIPTTDQNYQPALDQALAAGGKEAPDLYCAEAAFVLKYTQGDASQYACPYKDLGIDVDAGIKEAEIAQYTIDIGTNTSGDLVGLGYQATGGAFIYRRSIAKEVFGDDSPEAVSKAIGGGSQSWDTFFEAAETLKGKGYGIVSGDGDIWHAVENSSDKGWVVDGKLTIDPKREEFLDLSKKLKDNDYHNDTQDWQEGWFADMKGEGSKGILGFFGPAWLINYTLAPNCGGEKVGEGTYGDWGVCEPPIGFFWGGTWVLANKDSEHKEALGEIINWITLDASEEGLQYMWANGTGQNMFDIFQKANAYANGKNLTQYDEAINALWRDQVRQYTAGAKDRDAAIEDFKMNVSDTLDIEVE